MQIRRYYLDKLIKYIDTEFVKLITGVRRSGKSFILKMLEKHLQQLNKKTIYLNFEHPDTFSIQTADKLYEFIKTQVETDERIYFLFDEIAEVDNWQKLINGLRIAFNCDIYLTGSNAKMLSGELATYLSGRYVEIKVYPLSLVELKDFTEADSIDQYLQEYIKYGGFPSVAFTKDEQMKSDILKGIYNSILLKDVSIRGNITQIDVLMKLSLYLLDNIGKSVSSSKISNYFKSMNQVVKPETINKYLQLLENAFIFYKATRYDIRGKEHLKTLGKYYVVDLGLKNIMLGRMNSNLGSMIENVVYLKLINDGWHVFVGKYDDLEIDFVCFKDDYTKYVQVTLSMPINSTRETDNLLVVKDNYERIIVTYDYKDVGVIDGIKIVHLTTFLAS
ncbi:MAG: ATP-binding protein [Candidatus Izemoplasmatales bacterium]|nr:ATP-binding protein [Candidatus Izemoplasmatales bacterium]MDD5293679.1 ATP-binding protein [Candidatus Izemoplasmatales bacterium]